MQVDTCVVPAAQHSFLNSVQPEQKPHIQTEVKGYLAPSWSDTDLDTSQANQLSVLSATDNSHNKDPFDNISSTDFKAQEDTEGNRNDRLEKWTSFKSYPMAPHNTTQYLMDEHVQMELDFSDDSRETRYEFLQRNFFEDLEKCHVDRLERMSKHKVAQENME